MHLRSGPYINSALWKESEKMTNSLKRIDRHALESDASVFDHIKELLHTIRHDVKEALTNEDLHITLYHFSKAKSSCLVLAELLQVIRTYIWEDLANQLIKNNQDMILMLSNYIHLNRVNIVVDIRRKKK